MPIGRKTASVAALQMCDAEFAGHVLAVTTTQPDMFSIFTPLEPSDAQAPIGLAGLANGFPLRSARSTIGASASSGQLQYN